MKIQKKLLLGLLLFAGYFPLSAQSNQILDRYLNQRKADLGTTALLVYQAAGTLSNEAGPEDALEKLLGSSIGKKYEGKRADDLILYGQYAQIVMSELELPGGLMYSIFKNPRYAAKELTYRRWMPGTHVPNAELTPWDVTTSLSQILAWKEENK